MNDNCGEWVECMGVASGCGEQEAGVASGSGWNIDFIILLIPTPLFFFAAASLLFCSFFRSLEYMD